MPKYDGSQWWSRHIFLDNVTRLPHPKSATVIGNQLILTFSAPMDGGWVPSADTFTVKVNGSAVSLASADPVAVSGPDVTLTLASAVAAGDAVTVSYAKPESRPIRNMVCEYAPSFTEQAVTNFTGVSPVSGIAITSDPGDDDTYGLGDTIRVKLTFSEAVSVTGTPRLRIKMDPSYGKKWATYESGNGTAELIFFAHTVVEPNLSPQGIAVLANSLELNGGAIRFASSGEPAYLAHAGLDHDPNHKVDWRR